MRTVHTTIHGKEYALGCDTGQEEQLNHLVRQLNKRCGQLAKHLGSIPENLLLIYAALTFVDDSEDAQKKLAALESSVKTHGDDAKLQHMQEGLASHLSDLAGKIEKIAIDLERAA